MTEERYSRNEAFFGAEGQAKIRKTSVAIVGLGGLGSHVAQQLAYLGVETFALIDFDVVSESNLNRLVGAVDADLDAKRLKTEVTKRMVTAIKPSARVATHEVRLIAPEAQVAIKSSDTVFGCVDRDKHRLELTETCAQYAKPYFDLATDVVGQDQSTYGGRVVFCDGTRCLVCLPDLLDQQDIAVASLADDAHKEADRQIYGVDRDALARGGPSVVSINGVVASLAVTEFMVHITGLRPSFGQLTYRAESGVVRRSSDIPVDDCYYCVGLWGKALSG